jgi:hypothetical protein
VSEPVISPDAQAIVDELIHLAAIDAGVSVSASSLAGEFAIFSQEGLPQNIGMLSGTIAAAADAHAEIVGESAVVLSDSIDVIGNQIVGALGAFPAAHAQAWSEVSHPFDAHLAHFKGLVENTAGLKGFNLDALLALVKTLLPGIGPGIDRTLKAMLGESEPHSPTVPLTIGQSMIAAIKASATEGLSPPPAADAPAVKPYAGVRPELTAAQRAPLGAAGFTQTTGQGMIDGLTDWLQAHFSLPDWLDEKKIGDFFSLAGHADIDGVLARAMKWLIPASATGLIAQVVSAALSTMVIGSLNINSSGLAAMIGEFSGFKEILGPIHGLYHQANIATPWGYRVNKMLTPKLPGLGEAIWMHLEGELPPGETIEDLGAKHGFEAKWVKSMIGVADWDPGLRELLLLSEVEDPTPEWWGRRFQKMRMSGGDIEPMIEMVKRRRAAPYISGLATLAISHFSDGFSDVSGLQSDLKSLKFGTTTIDWAVKLAQSKRRREQIANTVKQWVSSYERDFLTDAQFAELLSTAYADPAAARTKFLLTRLGRFKRVYLDDVAEEQKVPVAIYRKAYINGLITERQLRTALELSGMQQEAADLVVLLDGQDRSDKLVAGYQKYFLPQLRDSLVNGDITLSQYRDRLVAATFPPGLMPMELALAGALAARAAAGRVERYQLPPWRRAYVAGLADGDQVAAVMFEAGLTEQEVGAQFVVLDLERDRFLAGQEAKQAADDKRLAADAAKQLQAELADFTAG